MHVSRLLVPHLDSDQWKHFVLNILLLVGGDATHSFISILLLHVLHTLDNNCTCQNNPRLGFGMFGNLHAFSSVSAQVVVWEAFLFLLTHHHLVHVCSFHRPSHSSSFITKIFSSCGWWCRKFIFFFFFPHTTICTYHPISLIIIHHNFHPNVTCSFICTKLQAPSSGGWALLVHGIS